MDYKVITDVGTEPVSLAEARLQCKVDADDTSHDTYLQNVLIPGAREYAEHYARCAFAERALEGVLDEFPF